MSGRPNQQTDVPLAHYKKQFASSDPKALSRKSGIGYDGSCFTIKYLGRTLNVNWPDALTFFADDGSAPSDYAIILLLRLLLEGTVTPPSGNFVAYAEMPWGEVYSRQFNGRCVLRLAASFGRDIEGFKNACKSLKGIEADAGDISYDIRFLDGLTIKLILWEGDDEFPPTAQILFSDNFPGAFSAEDIAAAGTLLINALKGRW